MIRYHDLTLGIQGDEHVAPFLVVATRANDSRIVLEEAETESEAEQLASRYREFCKQYAAVIVEAIAEEAAHASQYAVASVLRRHGPLGTCAIARILGLDPAVASNSLRRAVRKGLVEHVDGGPSRFGMWRAIDKVTPGRKSA